MVKEKTQKPKEIKKAEAPKEIVPSKAPEPLKRLILTTDGKNVKAQMSNLNPLEMEIMLVKTLELVRKRE